MTYVNFGHRRVTPDQKDNLVRHVFDSVASKYDLMNDVMSLGIHRLWKQSFVWKVNAKAGEKCLDVAGGTGDIAFRMLKHTNREASVILSDVNTDMLEVARKRALDQGFIKEIDYLPASAESLPVPDQSVDVYTIAFGLRNMTFPLKVLQEAYRVLKPGGRFFCLEFSKLSLPVLQKLYDQYSEHLIPKMGQWIAGDAESYQYLVESIREFDDQETLLQKMVEAGFSCANYQNLSGGIVAIHSGIHA